MQNPWYLFVVYGPVWAGIFFFGRRFFRRQNDMEQEADRLADTWAEGDRRTSGQIPTNGVQFQ